MAFVQSEMKFMEFNHSMRVSLYFPTDMSAIKGNEVKGVIWLLHGYYGCGQDWMLFTSACRYAADNGYILVAPDAENSFYTDMAVGQPYYTMMTKSLPEALARIYNLPTEREKNFICGLSMGGFGAMRIGLANPDKFAAIGCFSGAMDLEALVEETKGIDIWKANIHAVLGADTKVPPELDLKALAAAAAKLPEEEKPNIFMSCGRQDYWYHLSTEYRDYLATLPLNATYKEWDGVHEWNFWDRSLAEFIGHIQGNGYAERVRADWSAE